MNIDGKEYKFNLPVLSLSAEDIAGNNSKLKKILSAFDNGDNRLNVSELKEIFSVFQNMDVKGKNNKSDNKLTDDEIKDALTSDERLKHFSVNELKSFIKAVVHANNKQIKTIKDNANYVANSLYEQISGPSLNKNTIKKLNQINSFNVYYVLKSYEKIAKEPLVQALGEEWNFPIGNIKKQVLEPLVSQAKRLGIEVSYAYYENENDVKKLNQLAQTLSKAIEKELNNPKFNSSAKKQSLKSDSEKKAEEQKNKPKPAKPLNKEKPHAIAEQLYNQISGPSFNKNTITLLNKIGKNNAAQVITEYNKIAGQSLADAIDEEWGLDIKTIKEYLCKPLIEQAKEMKLSGTYTLSEDLEDMTSIESINNFINNWSKKIVDTSNNRKDIPQKINPKSYTLEALKKKYPNKECRQMGKIIIVLNKDGSTFMQVEKEDDGSIRISDKYNTGSDPTRVIKYKPDGTLDYFYEGDDWNGEKKNNENPSKIRLNNTVNELFEDIYHKIGGIIPGTRKSLAENIKQISESNILEIMAAYRLKTGESLFDAINGEIGLGDTRKSLIKHLSEQLDKAFVNLSNNKDVITMLANFKDKTDIGLLEAIGKDSGMPKDKKKAFTDKIQNKISTFVKSLNSNNVEKTLTNYQNRNISLSKVISEDAGLPKSVSDAYLNIIETKLALHISNMEMFDYMVDRVKTDYEDLEQPTLTAIIANEKGLSSATRIKLIRLLENRMMNEYLMEGTEKSDIKKQIEAELNKIAKDPDNMDVTLIDKLNSQLYNRDIHYFTEQDLKPANGKIDKISYQGGTGDCWLLASINAIARSKKGLNLLNNSLKVNDDGSVTVRLNGVNKSYTISKKDLYGAKELSTGDLDVRAIEIAFERYMMEYRNDDINGNWESVAFDVLIGGNKKIWQWNGTDLSEDYKERINNPNILVTASISSGDRMNTVVKATNGEEILANHAYTVVKADSKYVHLINPWNNGKILKLSYAEFKKVFDQFTDVEIP